MHAYVLRQAQTAEAGLLSALAFESKAHWGYSPDFMAACREELTYTADAITHPDSIFVVTETAEQVVGFYVLQQQTAETFELEALFVSPPWIGCGLGRVLLQQAKLQAAARGAQWLLIQGDPNAAGFYQVMGAEPCGERESDSIPGRYLPLYRINLTQWPLS